MVYKGLSKLLVNRLKPFMNRLVSPFQASFVSRRSIHENIIIAKEIVHSMNRVRGKKGFMVVKIDLEKAYDMMNWNFIGKVLAEIGVDEKLRRVIMGCVASTSMSVMWNGGRKDSFTPYKGLRQGDPLSPYLFVLGMEKLTHMIVACANEGGGRL